MSDSAALPDLYGVKVNPMIAGFSPDPSVVQVDGVYYLVNSTFEYLPGIPLYRSTDLVDWVQIGNVVTRPEQVCIGEVPTPGGVTVMVLLGVRPRGLARAFAPLGRETFSTKVTWVDSWPHVEPVVLAPRVGPDFCTDFSSPDVLEDPEWIAVRHLPSEVAVLSAISRGLTMTSDGGDLNSLRPSFLGRRQRHLSATVSTHVDGAGGTGGLAARQDEEHWFALEARGVSTTTVVTARAVLANMSASWQAEFPGHEVELRMEMTPPPSDFAAGAVGGDRIRLIAADGGQEVLLTELDGRYWSFETAKSFTGRVLGLFVTEGTVTFADFTYTDTSPGE